MTTGKKTNTSSSGRRERTAPGPYIWHCDFIVNSDVDINVKIDVSINVKSDVNINVKSDVNINVKRDVNINVNSDVNINVKSALSIYVKSALNIKKICTVNEFDAGFSFQAKHFDKGFLIPHETL